MSRPRGSDGGPLESLGERLLHAVESFGHFAELAGQVFRAAARPRFPWRETLFQVDAIGTRSLSIVLITALFTGMVLALQTGVALGRFGAKLYVGSVVGLSLARELAPVLTALMVSGRVGAGITAELGAMQVTEQVDAIRSMGADPVQKLVLPRVLAAVLSLPLVVKGQVVGGFTVGDSLGRVYTDDDLRLAQTFADQAAVALENARLYKVLDVRVQELSVLHELSRSVTGQLDGTVVGTPGRGGRAGFAPPPPPRPAVRELPFAPQ